MNYVKDFHTSNIILKIKEDLTSPMIGNRMFYEQNLDDYVMQRKDEFRLYPTESIVEHAKNIIAAHLYEQDTSVNKKDVSWMMTYLSSSEFVDCHNMDEESMSREYLSSLELLARIEYFAIFHHRAHIAEETSRSIENLETHAGCYDD